MAAVTLGALFLLSLFLPAYLGGPSVITAGSDTPLLVVFGVGGAAGVGALLSLTGHAVWNFVWPYSPTGGWRRPFPRFHRSFRGDIAPALGAYWDIVGKSCSEGGDRAVVSTAFLLYSEAPDNVREWIRRRYDRFTDALSACAAIVLGILAGVALYPAWNAGRLAVVIGFVVVALVTFAQSYEGKREAIEMEKYWFAVRADTSLPHSVTHVAIDSPAELSVRPRLR